MKEFKLLKAILTVFFLITMPFLASAVAGGQGSGGGDMCEDRIKIIKDDIKDWINKGGPNGLKLPKGWTINQYSTAMLNQIDVAKIKCVDKGELEYPITVNETPKVCRFDLSNNNSQISCDFAKFQSMNDSDQYVLVHHEFAGLANIEPPNGNDSNYDVSNQISGYLVNQIVKKLAVKPVEGQILSTCQDYQKTLRISKLQAQSAKEIAKMYQELSADASHTATLSRSLAIVSTVLWTGSFLGIGTGAASAAGLAASSDIFTQSGILAITKIIFVPTSVAITAYSGAQYFYSDYTGKVRADELAAEVYAKKAMLAFDNVVAELEQRKQKVDLNWSRLANSLTLGGIAERRTKELYEIVALQSTIKENKVAFIQKVYELQGCDNIK